MQNLDSAYENYHLTHSNFVEAYKMVNEYVTELYKLPKQFLDETEGTMGLISGKQFAPKAPSESDKSVRLVVDFMDQLDEFTMHTIGLFNKHMDHMDETEAYMQKAIALQDKVTPQNHGQFLKEYAVLTPQVNELMQGLKQIKERADDALAWMEKLELKWEDVQVKVRQAA